MPDCPLCRSSMRVVEHASIELDVCDACHGVWLDPGELELLAKLSDAVSEKPSKSNAWDFKCPRCSSREHGLVEITLGEALRCVSCSGVYLPRKLVEQHVSVSSGDSPAGVRWFRDFLGPLGYFLDGLSSLK